MIKAKTIPERTADICNRSGLPADVVQRVLEARAESILDDLKHGMRVVDYGVCSLKPQISSKLAVGGGVKQTVSVKCSPSPRIVDALNALDKFEIDESDNDKGSIEVKTLEAFT